MPRGPRIRPVTQSGLIVGITPKNEASALWKLVRKKALTPDQVRKLIAVGVEELRGMKKLLGKFGAMKILFFRRQVRLHFDKFVAGSEA